MSVHIRESMFLWAMVAAVPALAGALNAVPNEITHRGVIAVHGERFTGKGDFRFALVDRDTETYLWVNDGSGVVSPAYPANPVTLTVVNGIYSVRLGDTALPNMTAIPRAVFNEHDRVDLRIWFNDGVNGVHRLTPDQVITGAPYAQRLPNVFVEESTGNVGVGTTAPNNVLSVDGDADFSGKVGLGTPDPQNTLDVEGRAVIGATYAGATPGPPNGLLVEGSIGIGTSSPRNKLDVEGGAVVGYSYSGTESAPDNGLLVEGNVGIGTTVATEKLDVRGTTRTSRLEVTEPSGWGLVPPGAIVPFAGATPPTGWLMCNGAPYSRTEYAALYAAIGTAWGFGDGSTTFNVPDLRGRFLRGVDGGQGNDPNAGSRTAIQPGGNTGDNVGSRQNDATRQPSNISFEASVTVDSVGNHNHAPEGNRNVHNRLLMVSDPPDYTLDGHRHDGGAPHLWSSRTISAAGAHEHTATATVTSANWDSETRPINAYVHWIIKY